MQHVVLDSVHPDTDVQVAAAGGNWATLEDHCRDLAVERGLDLVVYTGQLQQEYLQIVNKSLKIF